MSHAGAAFGHQLNLLRIDVNGMGVPDIRPNPIQAAHIFDRSATELRLAELLLIHRFGHVGVQQQPPTPLPRAPNVSSTRR